MLEKSHHVSDTTYGGTFPAMKMGFLYIIFIRTLCRSISHGASASFSIGVLGANTSWLYVFAARHARFCAVFLGGGGVKNGKKKICYFIIVSGL